MVVLFFIAPLFLTKLVNAYMPNSLLFQLIEGVIRLAIFIGYLKVISLMPDIKRVFTYHGAEHKTVNAYEAGVPMEVDAIKKYSRAHVRCGTSFLFVVLVVAIVVFAFVGRPALWMMVLSRIVLIPVIMAVGYEVIYFGARHTGNRFVRILLAPGLLAAVADDRRAGRQPAGSGHRGDEQSGGDRPGRRSRPGYFCLTSFFVQFPVRSRSYCRCGRPVPWDCAFTSSVLFSQLYLISSAL